ncbi:MAG: MFS transporter [Candidatus Bathyarchaeaceae archaeon]
MKGNTVKNREIRSNPRFFQGNILVIAVSSAIRSFGGGFTSIYVSLFFIELGGSPMTLGLMASITLLVQCGMLPLGGFIADYYGRRRIMVLTAFYSVFFPLLYAVIRDWRLFAALSIIAALGAISNPASHAMVADSIHPEKRTTGIASLQVVSSLPVAAGPLIGGWLIQNHGLLDGFRLACLYAAVTAFASALIVFLFLKETLRPRPAAKSNFLNLSALMSFLKLLRSFPISLKALMVSYALVAFANGAVGLYYIIYATRVIGLTELEWGIIVFLQFLLVSISKVPGGWFSDRFGKRKVMIVSVLTCAPCTILFTLSRSFVEALIVALLLIVTGIYYAPAHEALQADLTPRTVRGRVTALWGVCNAFSGALGTLIGGFLFQTVNPAMPFYLFTAAELTAALILISIVKEPTRKEI